MSQKWGMLSAKSSRQHRLLGDALADLNEDAFKDCYDKIVRLDKKAVTPEERRVTRFFQAVCFKETEQIPEAVKMYEAVLDMETDYAPALSNLSVIYSDMKNYPAARF